MRYKIALVVALLTGASPSSVSQAQELEILTERVRNYSDLYLETIQNMKCFVEGSVAERPFHGEIALHNGVIPFHLPSKGGFFSSKVVTSGPGDGQAEETIMKIGNPRYSFMLVRQGPASSLRLDDLSVQIDDPCRKEVGKDLVFFSFSATDSEGVFAPMMVHDISTVDLLKGDRGVQSRIAAIDNSEEIDARFIFPEEHPFGHASAYVRFGKNGEVLRYELRDRSENGIEVSYFGSVRYSESHRTSKGLAMPTELRVRAETKISGKLTDESENWYKLSNFEFGKSTMTQFNLSHYGIPEPEGAKENGRQLPFQKQMTPPQMELSEVMLKFGNKADFSVALQNRNPHPIRIVGIGGSCGLGGCIEPKNFQPCKVEAHGSKSITVALKPNKPGRFEAELTIYYGVESVRSVSLVVEGIVED
ncbi:MAG: hypothetical protein ACE361_16765 [Aureliella sp.]